MARRKLSIPVVQNAIDKAKENARTLNSWDTDNRPTPTAETPYPFGLNTDTEKQEYWNGIEWSTSSSSGTGDLNEPGGNNILIL